MHSVPLHGMIIATEITFYNLWQLSLDEDHKVIKNSLKMIDKDTSLPCRAGVAMTM